MATFLEELRQCFRFVGYGEAGEKFTVTAQDGTIIRMLLVPLCLKQTGFDCLLQTIFLFFLGIIQNVIGNQAIDTASNMTPPVGVRQRRNVMNVVGQQGDGSAHWCPTTHIPNEYEKVKSNRQHSH